jgi:hypothetical protein
MTSLAYHWKTLDVRTRGLLIYFFDDLREATYNGESHRHWLMSYTDINLKMYNDIAKALYLICPTVHIGFKPDLESKPTSNELNRIYRLDVNWTHGTMCVPE